jgi:hypothetical protein
MDHLQQGGPGPPPGPPGVLLGGLPQLPEDWPLHRIFGTAFAAVRK